METLVAELCNDYDVETGVGYELLPRVAYTNAITSALSYYQKAKPRLANFIARLVGQRYIAIPTNLTPPFDPTKGSRVENIEFVTRDPNATNLYEKQAMVALVRRDVYVVEYSTELQQWVIRFIGKVTGTYRVTYTYIVDDITAFQPDEQQGIIFFAASIACDKIAAKFARVFLHKLPADLESFRQKTEYYTDLAKEYREAAYNILDINEKTGTMAYSSVASWGVRKVRRII